MNAIRFHQNILVYRTLTIGALLLMMLGFFSLREIQSDVERGVRAPATERSASQLESYYVPAHSAKAALSR